MNLAALHHKLIAAARRHPPRTAVPYAFETRIMARLRSRAQVDHWAVWARGLWRAVAPCLAIMILLGAWSALAPTASATPDLSQDFEKTVLAAIDQDQPVDSAW